MNDIEKSVGNENRYTFWCDSHGQRRFYGVCLWMKNAYDEGRISADDPNSDCAQAIKCGSCVALGMRAEEIEANESLYFSERVKFPTSVSNPTSKVTLEISSEESYMRGWNQVGQSLSSKKYDDIKIKEREKIAVVHKKPKFADDIVIMDVNLSSIITNEAAKHDLPNLKIKLSELKREIMATRTDSPKVRRLLTEAKKVEKSINDLER